MPEESWLHVIQLQEKLQAMQLIKYQTSSRIRTKLKKKKNDLMLWYFYHDVSRFYIELLRVSKFFFFLV